MGGMKHTRSCVTWKCKTGINWNFGNKLFLFMSSDSSHRRRFSNHESRLLSRSHTFAITVILDLKIHQSMWIHWPFFPKTWTKGHWPLDDIWPHICWGHMCDSTQGSLCQSPMTIHQCMWIQWSILQNTTYILHTYYVHTTYRMSDHIVSYLNSVQMLKIKKDVVGITEYFFKHQIFRKIKHFCQEFFIFFNEKKKYNILSLKV